MNSPREPERMVEHFFRYESAGLVALLTRRFGFASIDVIEDMVQESLLEALRSWRIGGVPDNPTAWLHRVARNRITDAMRRGQMQREHFEAIATNSNDSSEVAFAPDELQDGMLRMMFACCHPMLDRASQLALALKVLCGLSNQEIARGLLSTPAAVKKRITRAKQKLQLHRVSLDLPAPALLNERLDGVHEVLYLMFNEGYSATHGDQSLRIDLCEEAARLAHLLCESQVHVPATHALLALMLFHATRFDARMASDGASILLRDQDRTLWDRDMMRVADYWLIRATEGSKISRFHLEAGIARLHCLARSADETDWQAILGHYEMLAQWFPSPMVELNRAIVLGQLERPRDGLELLRSIEGEACLRDYPLFHCAVADLSRRHGDKQKALHHWRMALDRVQSKYEKGLIAAEIRDIA